MESWSNKETCHDMLRALICFFLIELLSGVLMVTNLRGIFLAIASGIFLTANDAISKLLVPNYAVGQILFITSLGVALLIWLASLLMQDVSIKVNSWKTHISRGLLFSISAFTFITALQFLPLAETMCIAFASPFFMTLFGRFFLGEYVGIYRITAVIVGFVGVVVVMQPGTPGFKWVFLLPLIVAISDAGRDVLTRKMTKSESSMAMVFTTSLTIAAVSLFTIPAGWRAFELADIHLFLMKTGLMLIAYSLIVEAYRFAPTVVIAPFRYIQIIWGVLFGVVLWGDLPSLSMYVGMLLTAGSGAFIAIRESRINAAEMAKINRV